MTLHEPRLCKWGCDCTLKVTSPPYLAVFLKKRHYLFKISWQSRLICPLLFQLTQNLENTSIQRISSVWPNTCMNLWHPSPLQTLLPSAFLSHRFFPTFSSISILPILLVQTCRHCSKRINKWRRIHLPWMTSPLSNIYFSFFLSYEEATITIPDNLNTTSAMFWEVLPLNKLSGHHCTSRNSQMLLEGNGSAVTETGYV